MLEFISVPEAAKEWGILDRRVQKLYKEKQICGMAKFSYLWMIAKDTERPVYRRYKKRGDCIDTNSNM